MLKYKNLLEIFVIRGGYASVLRNMLPLPRGLWGLLGFSAPKRHGLLLTTVVAVLVIFALFGDIVDAKVSQDKCLNIFEKHTLIWK